MRKLNEVENLAAYLYVFGEKTTKELKRNGVFEGRGVIRRAIAEGKITRTEVWEKNFKHDEKGRPTSKGTMHYVYRAVK